MTVGAIDIDFSESEFRELIDKLREGVDTIVEVWFPQLRPLLDKFFSFIDWFIPDWVFTAAYKLVDWCLELAEDLANLMISLFEGILVPISGAIRAGMWHGEIEYLGNISTAISDSSGQLGVTWQGEGQRAFALHAKRQIGQVDAMKDLANVFRDRLIAVVVASTAFYVSIGFIIAKTAAVDTAAVASTAVDGPVGPAAAGAATAVGIAEIGAVVGAFVGIIGVMVNSWLAVTDGANAIGDTWPSPNTGTYNDGSASDGDGTDWSTER